MSSPIAATIVATAQVIPQLRLLCGVASERRINNRNNVDAAATNANQAASICTRPRNSLAPSNAIITPASKVRFTIVTQPRGPENSFRRVDDIASDVFVNVTAKTTSTPTINPS